MSARARNPVCDLPKLDEHLATFREGVAEIERLFVERGPNAAYVGRVFVRMQREGIDLFRGLLQQLALEEKLRRKVEKGTRFWSRERVLLRLGAAEGEKRLAEMREVLAVAELARREGKPHDACLVSAPREAGGFRLINAGGFDDKTMATVARIVEEASRRLREHGLGAVIYGEITVTNTIARARVLALYDPKHDAMFVRANVKGLETETLRTVLHELGHRLQYKYTPRRSITALYQKTKRDQVDADALRDEAILQAAKPTPGERVVDKGRVYEVMGTSGMTVLVKLVGEVLPDGTVDPIEKILTGRMPLAAYLQFTGRRPMRDPYPRPLGFVTDYARKNEGETFAELVSFYCLGQLSARQKAILLEAIPPRILNAEPPAAQARDLVIALGSASAARAFVGKEKVALEKEVGTSTEKLFELTALLGYWERVGAAIG